MVMSPLILMLPAFYMSLSLLALNYFKVLYTLFTRAAQAKFASPVWAYVRPALQQGLAFTQHSLGPADKLSFSLTHVLLMAIVMLIIIEVGKIKTALTTAGRR